MTKSKKQIEKERKWRARADEQVLEQKEEYIVYTPNNAHKNIWAFCPLLSREPPNEANYLYSRYRGDSPSDDLALAMHTWIRQGKRGTLLNIYSIDEDARAKYDKPTLKKVIIYLATPKDLEEDIDKVNNFQRLEITRETAEILGQESRPDESKFLMRTQRLMRYLIADCKSRRW